ncbi:hypothetical protein [Haloparvum sp. PAK95]|uniref:hypothetical protein n=1 Tax=Haloparvum sp. PAK95 TaxID=3418962 RepID=UPI003D2F010D
MGDSSERALARDDVTFESAFAYALSPDMRRLVIVFLFGWLLSSLGLALFLQPWVLVGHGGTLPQTIAMIVGLVVTVAGAALLFGGLIGALFKTIVDANTLAAHADE